MVVSSRGHGKMCHRERSQGEERLFKVEVKERKGQKRVAVRVRKS